MGVRVSKDARPKVGGYVTYVLVHIDKPCIRVRVGYGATTLSMHEHCGFTTLVYVSYSEFK